MRRRTLLVALAALGTIPVAGCSLPAGPDRFRAFERRVREGGVDVKRAAADNRRWILEYYPTTGPREAFRAEVGTVARAYAESVPPESEGGAHGQLKCVLFRSRADRSRTGSYRIEAAWARQYAAGAMDGGTYLERVRATLDR